MLKWEELSDKEFVSKLRIASWAGAHIGDDWDGYCDTSVACAVGDDWDWAVNIANRQVALSRRSYKTAKAAQAACERWLRSVGLLPKEGQGE